MKIPNTVRGSETGAQAQPEGGFVRIARAILPLPYGGLLPRTLFNSVATLRERRTNPVVTDRRYNERRKHERQFYISHHRNGDAGPLRAAEKRQVRCAWIHYARGRGKLIKAGGDESFRPHLAANHLKPTRL